MEDIWIMNDWLDLSDYVDGKLNDLSKAEGGHK